jgi:HAMP domain-containing protein
MLHTLRWPLTRIFYSLRWRLTGWYVLLLTGVLLLFSAGTYIAVYKLLLDNFDDVLASQANLIVQTINFNDRDQTLQNTSLRADRRDDEHLTRIYRADGSLIYDDNPREIAPELADTLSDALAGDKQLVQVSGREAPMRVLTLPVTHSGQIVGALQVGVSLEDLRATMRTLLKVMVLMAPAMLLIASGGGLFLANRALTPIDRLTRTAQRISAEDLSQRINLHGPDDEVGRLARTFDAMLARLQSAFEQQRRVYRRCLARAAHPADRNHRPDRRGDRASARRRELSRHAGYCARSGAQAGAPGQRSAVPRPRRFAARASRRRADRPW